MNHPDYQLPKQGHVVLYGTNDRVSTEALTGKRNTGLDVEMTEIPDHPKNTLFSSSNSDWSNKTFSENSKDDWSRADVDMTEKPGDPRAIIVSPIFGFGKSVSKPKSDFPDCPNTF